MSDQQDNPTASAERANADLLRGLRRCHRIVGDYRTRLTAVNSNDPELTMGIEESDTDDGKRTG